MLDYGEQVIDVNQIKVNFFGKKLRVDLNHIASNWNRGPRH